MGRPLKPEPSSKDCSICKIHKSIDQFPISSTKNNPNWRRGQCYDCRNKLIRERHFKNDTYRKQYRAMTEEQRQAYIKKKSEENQIRFKTNPEALAKKKAYDKTDKAVFIRYSHEVKRRNSLKKGIKFNLTFEEFQKLINSPCFYCAKENCRGIDKVEPDKHYDLNNSVPACHWCNWMKSDYSLQDFKSQILKIAEKIKAGEF